MGVIIGKLMEEIMTKEQEALGDMTDTPASREQQAMEMLALHADSDLTHIIVTAPDGMGRSVPAFVIRAMLAFADAPRPESASGEGSEPTASDKEWARRTYNRLAAIHSRVNCQFEHEQYLSRQVALYRHALQATATPSPRPTQVEEGREATVALAKRLSELLAKVDRPNGHDWMFPLRVVPSDGKPIIASNRGGNLFRGYIATWQEADLIVETLNALPAILAALSQHDGEGIRAAVLAEREACAKVADGIVGAWAAWLIAAVIRARPLPPIAEDRVDD